jgi:hypothetical protein
MYFHNSLLDYVLFKVTCPTLLSLLSWMNSHSLACVRGVWAASLQEWVPRNWWQYTLTIIAIIVLGMFYELLKVLRSIWEGYMSKRKEAEILGFGVQRQAPLVREPLLQASRTYGSFVDRDDQHGMHNGLSDSDLGHEHRHRSRSGSGNHR